MPFKFLQSIKKDRHEKLKNKSKSTTDLLEGMKSMTLGPPDTPNNLFMKTKSKSRLHLFSSNKNSSQDNFNKIKKNKENENTHGADFLKYKKTESTRKNSIIGTEILQTTDKNILDQSMPQSQSEVDDTVRTTRTNRSASCCYFPDVARRERRLSDIAQLDQYIEYYQRRTADDGINAKRLVCAQILKQGFLRLEQMHRNDQPRPQEKPESFDSVSNINHSSSNGISHHFLKNKVNERCRSSQLSSLLHPPEHRLSLADQDSRRSSLSGSSGGKDENGPLQFVSNSVFDIDVKEIYGKDMNPLNSVTCRDLLKKPRFMSKRRSISTISATEIEIF